MVEREGVRAVKTRRSPGAGGMATLAAGSQQSQVECRLFVAARTLRRRAFEDALGMALRAGQLEVGSGQGEGRVAVIEGHLAPAQVELLGRLPASHPAKDSLVKIFAGHLRSLCQYQDSSGLWHQVLDRPSSYLETSCTAMFCYGLARGVSEGWLDRSYAEHARRAWAGVSRRVRPDGQIEGICRGTGVGFTMQFYDERPTPLNDTRGIGAVLLAGSAMLQIPQP